MIAPTSRAIVLACLGAPLSLLLANAAAPGLWAVGAVWAIAIAAMVVFDGAMAVSPRRMRVELKTPRTAPIGSKAVASHLLLSHPSRRNLTVEVALDGDALLDLPRDLQRVSLERGEGEIEIPVGLRRRGDAHVEAAHLRWTGPLGLAWRQYSAPLNTAIAISPDLGGVAREAQHLFSRTTMHGIKPLQDRGDGTEFDALAEFNAGMDRRMVEWKQSARHAKLLAKEVRAERNHHIVFAMDTGRVMCEPLDGAPRIDWCLNAALLLAYVALKLGDRVSFFAFAGRPQLSTGMAVSLRDFPHLVAQTAKLDYSAEETNYTLGLTSLAERLQRRSMIVVFTDFADSVSAELMVENITRLAKKHMIVFVTLPDRELEALRDGAPDTTDDVSRAVIAHRLLQERDIVLARLRRLGVSIVDAEIDKIGSALVKAYDRLRRLERV